MSTSVLLWFEMSPPTDAGQESIFNFLFAARQYFEAHSGHMEGFSFGAVERPWWWPLKTPFKAKAKSGCRIWRIPATGNITQDLADTKPLMPLTDGRVMDVVETWVPGGLYPAWFVVFLAPPSMLVCLADECAQS